ncbi:2-amino-4-hydroxy-6-hydroxymethyldihydropteridine diphosphokinase [Entomobacter blattae]|uniref:2-amino-4-hydroxy-6-hydroxymethyldihydropteridine pyrophosphokinase n=1 Tax=Entomobacter blattae TaxID=2762277 RepID=A0A7H1NSJ8_9PROT|nr:2-amino-4-hydroxy-6-hydroxymethyldihydropteridine diphosphokinase [Entomobacter blattae]QNT78758.1 2-amino-4-hydroxy-6-hydroxymethyldihydropteridine pyrophosphokinase [Entomobacter blattae]
MIVVAVGSNLADRYGKEPLEICRWAAARLSHQEHINVMTVSSWYKTRPVPDSEQPWYVNGVIRIQTHLLPEELLTRLHAIEAEAGRVRKNRNEARVLDLDLICYNTLSILTPHLVLPHPRMHERAFVLAPMEEIAAEWVHPLFKKNVREMKDHFLSTQKEEWFSMVKIRS